MKALVYNKKNTPDRLKIEDIEKPEPKDNEVLVKTISLSINAADYRSMKLGMIPKHKILGSAISGTVESIGKDVKVFKPGDQVLGELADHGFGGLAEFVLAPEEALAIKPAKVSFNDAVALPVAAITALYALRDKAGIKKGQDVLIVGSAGGVGTFAVQLAKYYGAIVTAVCSTKNIKQTISLGADKAIDYTNERFTDSDKRYDIILAINGNYPLLSYRRLLKSDGIYVMVGGKMIQILKSLLFGWILSFGGKTMKSLSGKTNPEDLEFLASLLAEGKIRVIIDKEYKLEDAAEAMAYLSEGHATGKVIINV